MSNEPRFVHGPFGPKPLFVAKIHAHGVHHTRAEVLRHHVVIPHELVHDRPPLRRAKVERHALLASVERLEVRAEPVRPASERPSRVAFSGPLDL
jgi:hypothetical protein